MAESVKDEIIGLERQYWQAMQDGSIESMLKLTDDPCVVTGAQGVGSLDHATFREMMKSPNWKLESFQLSDPIVRLLGADVAVVAYKVKEVLTVDGKSLTLDAAEASTWIRRDGRWVCALHTESVSGDPFGRDRKAIAD
jgi:hypothetical protein